MKKKRILIIAGSAYSLINFRLSLIKDIVQRNHSVIAAAPKDQDNWETAKILSPLGIKLHQINFSRNGLNPLNDIKGYFDILRLIKTEKPDIVFAYTVKPVIFGGMVTLWVGGIKFYPMITGMGYAFTEGFGLRRKIIRLIIKMLYKIGLLSARKVIFQNPDDEITFRNLKLMPKKVLGIQVSGSGISLSEYISKPIPKEFVFLMVARLLKDKGVKEYVEAARKIKRRFPNVIFRLAGSLDTNPSGIKSSELQSWIDEGVIEYLGFIRPIQKILTDCRFFVLPSYREGLPRSILEALATARPIITTNTPGCRETVVHGENGYLVPPRNVDELAIAMEKMILLPNKEIEKMANASLQLAQKIFDVEIVNKKMLDAMEL